MSFNLKASIGLDQSDFIAGLEQAKSAARKFGQDMESQIGGQMAAIKGHLAAAFSAGAILGGIKTTTEYASKINDLKAITKMSAQELQELDFAARQTGSSIEAVAEAIKKTRVAQLEALGGNKGKEDDFKHFGVSLEDLRSKNGKDLFLQIADAIGKSGDATRNLDSYLSIMGKSAGDILPGMVEGFSDLAKKARDAGIIMSDELVAKLDDIGDDVEAFFAKFRKGFGYAAIGLNGVAGFASSALAAPLREVWEILKGSSADKINQAGDEQVERAADSLLKAFFDTGDPKLTQELEQKLAAKRLLHSETSDVMHDIPFRPAKQRVQEFQQQSATFDSMARIGGFSAKGNALEMTQAATGREALQLLKEIAHNTAPDFSTNSFL